MSARKLVIIGATSLIAEHCARLWMQESTPDQLVLIARDPDKLAAMVADLAVRSPGTGIETRSMDFLDAKAIADCAEDICREQVPDTVLIAHGYMPDQQASQDDTTVARTVLEVNAVSPVLFAEAFARHMIPAGGSIGVIGSVAGDRGRQSNYVYGAAKGLVARYVEGMQHRLAGTALKVSIIKPGPTKTPMTVALHDKGLKLAPVKSVARDIVTGMARGRHVIYTPGKWFLIMLIIRHLPRFVFNRMKI